MAEPIRVAQMMTDMNYGGVEMVVMNYYRHMATSSGNKKGKFKSYED